MAFELLGEIRVRIRTLLPGCSHSRQNANSHPQIICSVSWPGLSSAYSLIAGLMLLVCGARDPAWADPGISVGTSSAAPGGAGPVPVYLFGNTRGVSVQFDMLFDTNRITAASAVADSAAQDHLLASAQPANGVLRVILYSLTNAQLGSGALIDFQFAVASTAPEGPLVLQLTNAVMADVTGSSVQPIVLQSGLLIISAGAGSQLTLLAHLVNGQVQLQLTGPANKNYILQSSPDLDQWINVSTNVLTDGQILLTNFPPPNSSRRFYRANYAP